MADTRTDDLIGLIESALSVADRLNLVAVGIHLNAALIELTGEGVAPPQLPKVAALPEFVVDCDLMASSAAMTPSSSTS